MDRGSTKQSPRLDDEMQKETAPTERPLTPLEAGERSELARFLVRRDLFPAKRWALVAAAIGNDAPTPIVRKLEKLPDGRFRTIEEVWGALGGPAERRAG